MKEVWLVKKEKAAKAEEVLRKDDLVGRQSITVRDAETLGMKKKGVFILVDGNKNALKEAEKLLKGIAEKEKNKEEVIKKIEEEESAAISGFGALIK